MDLSTISRKTLATDQANSPFLFFDNSEDTAGRVYGESPEVEMECRDTPPLDRFLAHDRRDTKEIKGVSHCTAGSDEIPAMNRGKRSSKGKFLGKLVDRLHYPPCLGPSAFMLFA